MAIFRCWREAAGQTEADSKLIVVGGFFDTTSYTPCLAAARFVQQYIVSEHEKEFIVVLVRCLETGKVFSVVVRRNLGGITEVKLRQRVETDFDYIYDLEAKRGAIAKAHELGLTFGDLQAVRGGGVMKQFKCWIAEREETEDAATLVTMPSDKTEKDAAVEYIYTEEMYAESNVDRAVMLGQSLPVVSVRNLATGKLFKVTVSGELIPHYYAGKIREIKQCYL